MNLISHRDRLRDLLIERSLQRGDFVLASGARSTYYFDARKTLFSAEGQFLIGLVALEALRHEGLAPDWVGGLTMGADPIAFAMAHRSWIDGDPIQAFSVRKEPKSHGLGSQIEGGLPSGAKVVVVEDALTSGGSSLRAIRALKEHGVQILATLTVVDREAGGRETLEGEGVPLIALYTAAELLASAPSL